MIITVVDAPHNEDNSSNNNNNIIITKRTTHELQRKQQQQQQHSENSSIYNNNNSSNNNNDSRNNNNSNSNTTATITQREQITYSNLVLSIEFILLLLIIILDTRACYLLISYSCIHCLQTLVLLFKFAHRKTKGLFVSITNKSLVGTLITVGDVTVGIPISS